VLVGGGRVFGPQPRDYGFKLNKKVRQLARKSALSYKAQENAIVVVEDFTFDAPKTKNVVEVLKNLKVDDKKTLIVLPGADKAVYLSARNIERVQVMAASALNTYKVLDADILVLAEGALSVVEQNLNK
jgi:large subunit ribosomal protein L4